MGHRREQFKNIKTDKTKITWSVIITCTEFLVRGHPFGHVVDDGLLFHVPVLADDVGAGKFSGALVRNANHSHIVDAGMPADQILQL